MSLRIAPPARRGRASICPSGRCNNRTLVLYFILVFAAAGVLPYERLGQSEDPPFTFRVMVVKTLWPGATAHEVEQQVTDRVERKLAGSRPTSTGCEATASPASRWSSSRSRTRRRRASAPDTFYQVRKKIGDIRNQFPAGIQGPFFNDEFGDTYTNIYALTGDGFGYRDLKEFGDKVRAELLRVPGVAKVDFFGEQDEKVFIELSNTQARDARRRARADHRDAVAAERGGASRRVRHATRPHLRARPPAPSTTSMRSATSRSAPTTACSAWATSPR